MAKPLTTMNVTELKQTARELGIRGFSKWRAADKSRAITIIREAQRQQGFDENERKGFSNDQNIVAEMIASARTYSPDELSEMTLGSLKKLARDLGITGFSKYRVRTRGELERRILEKQPTPPEIEEKIMESVPNQPNPLISTSIGTKTYELIQLILRLPVSERETVLEPYFTLTQVGREMAGIPEIQSVETPIVDTVPVEIPLSPEEKSVPSDIIPPPPPRTPSLSPIDRETKYEVSPSVLPPSPEEKSERSFFDSMTETLGSIIETITPQLTNPDPDPESQSPQDDDDDESSTFEPAYISFGSDTSIGEQLSPPRQVPAALDIHLDDLVDDSKDIGIPVRTRRVLQRARTAAAESLATDRRTIRLSPGQLENILTEMETQAPTDDVLSELPRLEQNIRRCLGLL